MREHGTADSPPNRLKGGWERPEEKTRITVQGGLSFPCTERLLHTLQTHLDCYVFAAEEENRIISAISVKYNRKLRIKISCVIIT